MTMTTKIIPLVAAIAATSSFSYSIQAEEVFALEEIVVTAQRREESLSEVPLSVTAADGEALATARVENIANVSAISPSVQFAATNNSSSSSSLIIRGLGTTGNSRAFEGSVGTFIDGVYRTRSGAALESFLDINNLQVLRGPQGTLFGKNTSAGAIILNSTTPSLEEVETSYNIGLGNYGAQDYKVATNLPTGENSAVRIAALYSEDDGFFEDVNTGDDRNGKDTKAIKAQWLWQPSDELSIHLIADTLESKGDCCYGQSNFQDGAITPITNGIMAANGLTIPSNDLGDYETSLNSTTKQTVTDKGAVLKVEYEMDAGTLTSTTAYRKFRVDQQNADADFIGVDIARLNEDFESEFYSQEFTFTGDLEALNGDYILGLFYSHEDITVDRQVIWGSDADDYLNLVLSATYTELFNTPVGITGNAPAGLAVVDEDIQNEAESVAIFFHANFDLNDQWKLVTGLRYSEEEKSGSFRYDSVDDNPGVIGVATANPATTAAVCTAAFGNAGCNGLTGSGALLGILPAPAYDEDHTDRAFSGTIGLQYFPSEETMIYMTYNHGFKAGGVNIDANAAGGVQNNPVFGGTPLDPTYDPEIIDGVELGLKTTYWDGRARTNIAAFYNEIEDLQVAQFVGLQFTILNAESAKSYGLEFENLVQLNETFSASLDATWLPYAKYGLDETIADDISNQRMIRAPHVTSNAALNFDHPLSDNLSLTGRLQYQYRSSQEIGSGLKEDSVGLVNANLSLVSESHGWQVELWGQNITGEEYATAAFNSPFQSGDFNAYVGAPRTYGITLRGSF